MFLALPFQEEKSTSHQFLYIAPPLSLSPHDSLTTSLVDTKFSTGGLFFLNFLDFAAAITLT